MQNSIYKIKDLLFLSWDWEAWCLTVWGVILPPERNTACDKGRKCFHCLGAPNNLIRPWVREGADNDLLVRQCTFVHAAAYCQTRDATQRCQYGELTPLYLFNSLYRVRDLRPRWSTRRRAGFSCPILYLGGSNCWCKLMNDNACHLCVPNYQSLSSFIYAGNLYCLSIK